MNKAQCVYLTRARMLCMVEKHQWLTHHHRDDEKSQQIMNIFMLRLISIETTTTMMTTSTTTLVMLALFFPPCETEWLAFVSSINSWIDVELVVSFRFAITLNTIEFRRRLNALIQ